MSFFCSFLWGCLAFASMYVTIKYYLPVIHARLQKTAITLPSDGVEESVGEDASFSENNEGIKIPAWCQQKRKVVVLVGMGVVFGLVCGYFAYWNTKTTIALIEMTIIFAVISAAFVTDLAFKRIPNMFPIILLIGKCIVLIYGMIFEKHSVGNDFKSSVLAMLISLILLLIVYKITGGGIGLGDVKLLSAIGFMGGLTAVCYTLFFAFFTCMVVSTVLLLCKKKTMKDTMPLGPFIWIGYGIALILARI